ncbi:hypothetical protein J6590_091095 [Homalodisca vitripennis]|nr:hypothetical protein J6590_091095 [Homalodisca vitripennis]
MAPRINTPTDEQTSSWLSITASETWEMVEDENCSAPEIRVSAPAAKPRTPTSPAVATMTFPQQQSSASPIVISGRTMPLPASSFSPLLSGCSGDAGTKSPIASLSSLIKTTSSSATATTLSVDILSPASP